MFRQKIEDLYCRILDFSVTTKHNLFFSCLLAVLLFVLIQFKYETIHDSFIFYLVFNLVKNSAIYTGFLYFQTRRINGYKAMPLSISEFRFKDRNFRMKLQFNIKIFIVAWCSQFFVFYVSFFELVNTNQIIAISQYAQYAFLGYASSVVAEFFAIAERAKKNNK